ncbi:MAG: hypothetical protein Q9173_001188 [Seirophora scorigena]
MPQNRPPLPRQITQSNAKGKVTSNSSKGPTDSGTNTSPAANTMPLRDERAPATLPQIMKNFGGRSCGQKRHHADHSTSAKGGRSCDRRATTPTTAPARNMGGVATGGAAASAVLKQELNTMKETLAGLMVIEYRAVAWSFLYDQLLWF